MDEETPPQKSQKPRHVVMSGPPWGSYVDPELAYIRGQLGSVGSGALGGRSCSDDGGFVKADPEETRELIEEAHRILAARAEEDAGETPSLPAPSE